MKAGMSRSRKFSTNKVGFVLFRKALNIPEQTGGYNFTYASTLFFSLGVAGEDVFFPWIKG